MARHQSTPQNRDSSGDFKNISEQNCIGCKSNNIKKMGFRETKSRGKQQRFLCKNCKKSFTLDEGFWKMKNNEVKITQCIDIYFRGVSLRKIQEHLQTFEEHNCSHVTILKWIRKYCNLIGNYTDSLKLNTSKHIQVDEMEYKTKGKDSWFIDVIDPETRYMVASSYCKSRSMEEIKTLLRLCKEKDGNIDHITTDGFKLYKKIVTKTFRRYGKKVEHKVITASRGEGFVHKVERLHNNIRERTKIMRQFNQLHSAKSIMKGYEIFYNFCRKHQAINRYPYELTTDLELGKNKWLDLIKLAKKKKQTPLS